MEKGNGVKYLTDEIYKDVDISMATNKLTLFANDVDRYLTAMDAKNAMK